MSDGAFALLNSLTSPEGSTNPMLAPVASFAGDAQALSGALAAGKSPDASSAMAALLSDRSAVDMALAAHPGALNVSDWNSLKQQLDKLATQVKPASVASIAPSASAGSAGASASRPAAAAPSDTPQVRIESYSVTGHAVHVKGFFEGVALKSAGVYDGDQLVRDLNISQVPGRQHVSFDIEMAQVQPGMNIRVYDGAGLSAEASIASRMGIEGTGGAKEVELGPPTDEPVSLGGEVASVETDSSGHNVVEIPPGSPSRAHVAGLAPHTRLGNLQINIVSATLDDAEARTYDVIGQVNGTGIRHAGIYVDGKLATPIDLDADDSFTAQPFDETFQMNGHRATVRVYDAHEDYIESPIRFSAATPETPPEFPSAPPAVIVNPNPNGLSVQITSLRQVAPNLMAISGVISGKSLASAGVYQNGIQVQSISVSGGVLGLLTSSSVRQVNFSVQVNPIAGPVSIRVFDSNGQFAEQPAMLAGGNPYATNPYGNPYGPRYGNGYGYPPPPNNAPWWQRLLH